MPVLRAALGGIGLLALILAAWMVHLRAPVAVVFWLCVIGAVLVFAALFERVTYKKLAPRKPPPDFVPSAERFIDPAKARPGLCEARDRRARLCRSRHSAAGCSEPFPLDTAWTCPPALLCLR
jgi:hypothetical protein